MTAATATRDVPVWVALSATAHAISYVQVGPWRTRVLQAGPDGGEPLILMAGTGGHLEAYAHNIPAFAQRPRVIAYDYPGHGYTTFALAYFGVEGLPRELVKIPLEYFKKGFDWLRTQDTVDGRRLGVVGGSKGGELALLLGATFPEIKVVVARAPSGTPRAGV